MCTSHFFLYNLLASFVREGKEIKNFNLNYFSYRSLGFLGTLRVSHFRKLNSLRFFREAHFSGFPASYREILAITKHGSLSICTVIFRVDSLVWSCWHFLSWTFEQSPLNRNPCPLKLICLLKVLVALFMHNLGARCVNVPLATVSLALFYKLKLMVVVVVLFKCDLGAI